MEVELLLEVVGEEELGRIVAEQALTPAEFLAGDEQTEQGDEAVEHPAATNRLVEADDARCGEQPDGRPLDGPILLQQHLVLPGRDAPEPQHRENPEACREMKQQTF